MTDLLKDIKHAGRSLVARPGFTAVAAVSLALGIGLNTTIFSLVNAVLLRPAPVERPGELVRVYSSIPGRTVFDKYSTHSYLDYLDFRDSNDVFSGLASHSLMVANFNQAGRSQLLIGEIVSANYFEVLGTKPLIGRVFLAEEDQVAGAHPVALLGDGFWKRQFGGNPDVLGETLRLNAVRYAIVGVLPPRFTGMSPGVSPDVWVPTMMADEITPMGMQGTAGKPATDSLIKERGRRWMFITGRLKPGVSIDQAQGQMAAIAARLDEEYPDSNEDYGVALVPSEKVRIHPLVDTTLTPVAAVLLGVVGIVLLIACANVANMLLAKATTRQREIALRLAIGASRARLVRQLLVESLLLSGLGGAFGLLLAVWATGLLQRFRPPIPITITLDLGIDVRVLVFTLAVSVLTGLVFGLAPALQAWRTDLVSSLKETTFEKRPGRRFGVGNLLVVGQVALSLVLMVGAGLLVRSLVKAQEIDLGFDAERLGIVSLDLEMNGYDDEQAKQFYKRAVERVRSLPGVESATDATQVPLGLNINLTDIWVEGHELTPDEKSPFSADVTFVGDDYFRTMGVPLLDGRDFLPSDTPESPRVAVVNEAFARLFWPNQSAVAKHLRLRTLDGPICEIVGVARNHKVRTVGEDDRPYVHYYRPQRFTPYGSIVFRTHGDAAIELETVRRELLSMDPDLLIIESATMADRTALSLFPLRAGSQLLGGFGILAVVLATVGLYGLIAYWVSQRTREVGVRIALGADSSNILGFVLKRGLLLTGVGVVVGLAGAAALSHVLRGVLQGIQPIDPITYAGAAVLLFGVALLANVVPARRAATVDPLVALRYE